LQVPNQINASIIRSSPGNFGAYNSGAPSTNLAVPSSPFAGDIFGVAAGGSHLTGSLAGTGNVAASGTVIPANPFSNNSNPFGANPFGPSTSNPGNPFAAGGTPTIGYGSHPVVPFSAGTPFGAPSTNQPFSTGPFTGTPNPSGYGTPSVGYGTGSYSPFAAGGSSSFGTGVTGTPFTGTPSISYGMGAGASAPFGAPSGGGGFTGISVTPSPGYGTGGTFSTPNPSHMGASNPFFN